MKIRHLNIKNFRGIQELEWALPETNLVSLIGRGDSTKSSILDAIRYAFFPTWNPTFDEYDFFNGETSNSIEITVTLGELPSEFLSDLKYGHWLRGWNKEKCLINDEPEGGLEDVISVCLTVNENLEPKWNVICDRKDENCSFKLTDRAKVCVTFIGSYADKHLTWSKNSALSRITDLENISASLVGAARAAKEALNEKRATDLSSFDAAAKKAENVAKKLGVPVSNVGAYKAQLDTNAFNIHLGGLSLHDENLPLRRLGLGSRRMLTFGLQQQNLEESHITLIDEIEVGLEPHRIARLLRQLEADKTGQYFLTTHSPVVLRELTVDQIFIGQSVTNVTTVTCAAIPGLKDNIQGKIRSGAEAFLATKIIVCEGATEVGLGRGLDEYWINKGGESFSFFGVALFDASGGSKVRLSAEAIKSLGYDVAVIVDSDADDQFPQQDDDALKALDVCVVKWDGGVSIEEYFFLELPWDKVIDSVKFAKDLHDGRIIDQIRNLYDQVDDNIDTWQDSVEIRKAIGKVSHKKSWFKRQDLAEEWIGMISEAFDISESKLSAKVNQLKEWVESA